MKKIRFICFRVNIYFHTSGLPVWLSDRHVLPFCASLQRHRQHPQSDKKQHTLTSLNCHNRQPFWVWRQVSAVFPDHQQLQIPTVDFELIVINSLPKEYLLQKMTGIYFFPPTLRKGEGECRIKRLDQYEQGSSGSPGRVEGDLLQINIAGRCQWETAVMKNSISWPAEGSGWILAENR